MFKAEWSCTEWSECNADGVAEGMDGSERVQSRDGQKRIGVQRRECVRIGNVLYG